MIRPIDPAVSEATQSRLRDALRAFVPDPKNREYALALQGIATLRYRDRVFRVPPVPYPAGLKLQGLFRRLDKVKESPEEDASVLREVVAVLEAAVALFHTLVQPVTLVDRLFWRYRANPFAEMTEQEAGELLGFFWARRTKSTVRLDRREMPVPFARSISPTTSRSSVGTSLDG